MQHFTHNTIDVACDDGVTLVTASSCCMTDQQAQMVQRQQNTRVLVPYVKLSSPWKAAEMWLQTPLVCGVHSRWDWVR
jgi:hypothetical protein